MSDWTPLTREQIERRFIEMINSYLKLDLQYPLNPEMSMKDLRMVGNTDIENLPPELQDIQRKNLEVDSIDLLELVIQIEEEFGVIIDDSEIAKLLTWHELIGYIGDSQTQPHKK